jgi:hypothetical protein
VLETLAVIALFALAYAVVGLAIVVYETHVCSACYDELQEHGWFLVATVAALWPVFLWQWLRAKL